VSLKDRASAFWKQPERRRQLRDLVDAYEAEKHDAASAISLRGFEVARIDEAHRPALSSLGRWARSENRAAPLQQRERLSAVLLALVALFKDEVEGGVPERFAGLIKDHAASLRDALGELRIVGEAESEPVPEPSLGTEGGSEDTLQLFSSLLCQILGITPELSSREAEAFVLPPEGAAFHEQDVEYRQAFLCYRFASDAGRMAKSYTVVFAPTRQSPIAYFHNYYLDGEDAEPRKAVGAVLPFRNATYFIGRLGNNLGLKVMAFRRYDDRHRDSHVGLTMTFDRKGRVITSRIAMVRCDHADHKSASIGIFGVDHIAKELGDKARGLLNRIRNRISFVPEGGIAQNGEVLSVNQMVIEIGKALNNADGTVRFTMGGEAFNPADTDQYTFNQALTADD